MRAAPWFHHLREHDELRGEAVRAAVRLLGDGEVRRGVAQLGASVRAPVR